MTNQYSFAIVIGSDMMAQMDADSDKIALENKQGTCFYNFVMC